MHVLLERLGLGHPHHPLGGPHRQRRVGGDLQGQLRAAVGSSASATTVDEAEIEHSLADSVRPVKAISAALA